MSILTVRKHADTSTGERVKRWDPETGDSFLVNPATGQREPWPLLGVSIEGEVPEETTVGTRFVDGGRSEGWISVEGEKAVVRPAGPSERPYLKQHTFVHFDAITLHTLAGDVRYRVVRNPDKWHDGPEGTDVAGDPTARVENFYTLEREG